MANLTRVDSVEIEITNRTQSFKVPKEFLCSKIPYFEKMFSNDYSESKTLNVNLDLDEDALRNILYTVINGYTHLSFDTVLKTMSVADYLMMDNLKIQCHNFFTQYFTIDHLPFVVDSLLENECASSHLNLISKPKIDCFIKRHFLKISNTPSFLNFPLKTIEYIYRLDVIVDSEYQKFEVIMQWIRQDLNGRKLLLSNLSQFIHWSRLSAFEMSKIKANPLVMEMSIVSKVTEFLKKDCAKTIKSNGSFAIFELNNNVEVLMLTKTKYWSILAKFVRCNELSTSLFINEYITDIIYDSGRKGIRLDWENKKYIHLRMFGGMGSYYGQISKYMMNYYTDMQSDIFYMDIRNTAHIRTQIVLTSAECIIDSGSHFTALTLIPYGPSFSVQNSNIACCGTIRNKSVFLTPSTSSRLHSCTIQDTIYVLDATFKLFYRSPKDQTVKTFKFIDEDGLHFQSLELFNSNGKLSVCDKASKKIYEFDKQLEKWRFDSQIETEKNLIAMVSTSINLPKLHLQSKI
ncbi:uncharacterized protein LOC128391592 [Panonychus citri]|uniref:uncharacterized protein LOC128391592 n=1 Tax=Panonychus citri TaxID=50023 RepID=UPI0023070D04|nr:uncharacterized protein LOC128391592 [Panonychus citri]